ncbi:MAG TPA: hypothetical protein VFX56_03770 [Nitrospira sp.]|nr:hypothetical protein [Nitrospira sp.]
MPHDDDQKARKARAGARRLIEQTPIALAGLGVITGLAYLAGSFYTRAYFAEFGASWILDEVPAAIYFSQSWIPLLLILFFVYLATTNLGLIDSPSHLTASTKFKISVIVVQYGSWLFILLLVVIPLLSLAGATFAAIVLSVISVVVLLWLLASALELLVVRLITEDLQLDLTMARIACVLVAVGLYVIPAQLGMNRARADKHTPSSLLTVYLHGNTEKEYKLLFSADERLYVFPAKFEGDYPSVEGITAADVSFLPLEK